MKIAIAAALTITLSQGALAGVAEQKEIHQISDGLRANTSKIQEWCGNPVLTMTVSVAEAFKQPEIAIARSNILDEFLAGMKSLCADEDYRAQVMKLTEIKFSLTDETIKGSPKGVFKLTNGATLEVTVHVRQSLSNGLSNSIPDAIKKLY